MPGASSSASGHTRFWTRRRWQSNNTDSPDDHSSVTPGVGYFERGSSSSSLQESSDYFNRGGNAPSPRDQRHRVLRRVSSAISPASPSFDSASGAGGEGHGIGVDAAHSPISPLTPEALKRRATRLGSLIGKGRRDEPARGTTACPAVDTDRQHTARPALSQSYSSFGEQPRSAPSAATTFPQRSSAHIESQQRFSTASTQSYHTRTDYDQGVALYQRSSFSLQQPVNQLNHFGHAIPNPSRQTSEYSRHQPLDGYPEAPPQHIISVQTYPPPSMSRRPSTPPRSHPRRPSEQSDEFQDASELAAFAEATSALSFFPGSSSRRSSRSSVATGPRSSARALTPSPSHRPSSSRSAASPARMAAPLPPIPGSTLSRARSPTPRGPLPPSQARQRDSLGPPPSGPLPLLPVDISHPPPSMQRSTSYASTFAHNPSIDIAASNPDTMTPTTPEGVQRSDHTANDLTQARSRSPLRFNLPSRTLTDIAPPPTRRPQPGHNSNNNIITRSQALAQALQGMDADDESLATGHGSGNLHGSGPTADAAGGGAAGGAQGGDDELPDYATSQMEYAARQRWEAALRARELDEAWRRTRGRGLR